MKTRRRIGTVEPKLEELLRTPEARERYEEASAALEAADLVRSFRARAIGAGETRGITQTELATRLGISQARVSEIESGRGRDGPSFALLRRIARTCGIDWPPPLDQDEDAMPAIILAESDNAIVMRNVVQEVGTHSRDTSAARDAAGRSESRDWIDAATVKAALAWAARVMGGEADPPWRGRVQAAMARGSLSQLVDAYHRTHGEIREAAASATSAREL